jgi:cytochrome P450 PksS
MGTPVIPLLAAAGHDPRVFEAPESFDVARSPDRYIGFGHGIRFCLGAPLARMEMRIALTTLLLRCPGRRFAVEPEALRPQEPAALAPLRAPARAARRGRAALDR